jgi:hypothetical protein
MKSFKQILTENDNRKELFELLQNLPQEGLSHRPNPAAVFSIINYSDLRGYTPIAVYYHKIDKRDFNSDLNALYKKEQKRPVYSNIKYIDDYMLLNKDGEYYVYKENINDGGGEYGLNVKNIKPFYDVLLPSKVYDFFISFVNN